MFASIPYCSVGRLHGSCQPAIFGLRDSTRVTQAPGPLPLLSLGGRIKVHPTGFALGQVQVNGMAIEKQAHAMGKTKYLYSGLAFIGAIRHFA